MDVVDIAGTGKATAVRAPLRIPAHLSTPAGRFPVANLELRGQASRAMRSPRAALGFAAYTLAISRTLEERQLALAGVDVIATGRLAHAALLREPELLDRDVLGTLPDRARERIAPDVLAAALREVRARLAEVRAFVEGDGTARVRPKVGGSSWVAGVPELDRPWAPLNVGTSRFGWRRTTVGDVRVRYVATGPIDDRKTKVVLYLHGLGSRGEEGAALGEELARRGPYVVVAPDLPGQGYTDPVPPHAPLLDVGDVIESPHSPDERFLFLSYLDRFLDGFVAALDAEAPGFSSRLVCVAGGSLGGNLALRATLRKTAFAVRSIASWSAGSVWDPFVGDAFKELAATQTLRDATMDEHLDARVDHWISSTARNAYFERTFVQEIALDVGGKKVKVRGPQMWWRAACPGFVHREGGSLADRLEVYDETFRRWQSRLAYEQLLFSHRAAGRPALLSGVDGSIPTLLLAGAEDDFHFSGIASAVRDLGKKLAARNVPGRTVILGKTGHSIHDERPAQLAELLDGHLRGAKLLR